MALASNKELMILFVVLANSIELKFLSFKERTRKKDLFGMNEMLDCEKGTYSQDPFLARTISKLRDETGSCIWLGMPYTMLS